MKLTRFLHLWVRGVGALMIALGLLIWTGKLDALIPFHMLLGVTLVLAVWTLAILALRERTRVEVAALALIWGLITPALGMTQTRIFTGSAHWVVQIIHLLVGLGLIGLGDTLARAIRIRKRMSIGAARESAIEGAR